MFSCSVMSNSVNPWTAACRLLCPLFAQTHDHELLIPSNHLIYCCPLLLLPSIFPSFRVFSNELAFSHQVAIILELQLQHQSFQLIFRVDFLQDSLVSLLSKGLSRVFSSTTLQKSRFFSAQLSYGPTLTFIHDYWKNHNFDYTDLCQQSDVSDF